MKEWELSRQSDLFIAEGEHLVRRLLASKLQTHSVFLSQRRVRELAPLAPAHVPVYVAPDEVMRDIIGFKFHSGVIAAGRRPTRKPLDEVIDFTSPRLTLVICPELTNAENLGSIIRISAAFGVDALLLGPRCVDPFMRQSVRVSMGTLFRLPVHQSVDLHADLDELRTHGIQLLATVLDPSAELLSQVKRADRCAILFGSEAQGLDPETIARCDRRITIPMKLNTDSLNVAIAAGVFLYELTKDYDPE